MDGNVSNNTFKLDEGFSEELRTHDDGTAASEGMSAGFEEWVMAQSEDNRAGESLYCAYALL